MDATNTLGEAFDVDAEEGSSFSLLPKGKYTAEITHASVAPTKRGNGTMVSLTWTITEGEHEKRLVFQTILIQHESPDAQRFGRQRFKDVCAACGVTGQITDLDVLLHKPCLITVGIEEDKSGQYDPKNKVARVMSLVPPKTPGTGGKHDLNDAIPF